MSKHYAIAEFFRQAPNAMLARYFSKHGCNTLLVEDWPEQEYERWLALFDGLSETEKAEAGLEFQDIHAMATSKGFEALREQLADHLRHDPPAFEELAASLGEMPNHYHRAFKVFLDYRKCWQAASRCAYAESLGFWTKRKGLPSKTARSDDASLRSLETALATYYWDNQSRGRHCHVEVYHKGSKDLFFAYPEDYSQRAVEWVDGRFAPRPHNPAFEVVYVYDGHAGTLDISARGGKNVILALQGIFVTHILDLPALPQDPDSNRVYDLSPLTDKHFDFEVPAESEVEYVRVKRIRFSSQAQLGERITVEASPKHKPKAVYDLIDAIKDKLKAGAYTADQVDLTASLCLEVDKPSRTMSFKLSLPNHCSLKYDRASDLLRDVLGASGIELKAKAPAAAAPSTAAQPPKAKPAPSA